LRQGLPVRSEQPRRLTNVDGRCIDVAGVRVAGLGGSMRYRKGPNQYTEAEQQARAATLLRRTRRKIRDGRGIDVLLTHSPAAGIGDGTDDVHRGFAVFHTLLAELTPRYLVHGHVYADPAAGNPRAGQTTIINATGYQLIDI
jgi:Icc-related predicted phosphoesterase